MPCRRIKKVQRDREDSGVLFRSVFRVAGRRKTMAGCPEKSYRMSDADGRIPEVRLNAQEKSKER